MKSRKVAFGGIVAALSLCLMLMTGLIPVGTYALPCIAGILLVVIVIEFGLWWALGVYLAVGTLSFLFAADKEAALYYVMLLGIYPVVKSLVERIKPLWLSFCVKFLFFNAVAIGAFYIGVLLLSIPKESFSIFGFYIPWVFLIAGNFVFLIYDICLSRLIFIYLNIWRNRFKFH